MPKPGVLYLKLRSYAKIGNPSPKFGVPCQNSGSCAKIGGPMLNLGFLCPHWVSPPPPPQNFGSPIPTSPLPPPSFGSSPPNLGLPLPNSQSHPPNLGLPTPNPHLPTPNLPFQPQIWGSHPPFLPPPPSRGLRVALLLPRRAPPGPCSRTSSRSIRSTWQRPAVCSSSPNCRLKSGVPPTPDPDPGGAGGAASVGWGSQSASVPGWQEFVPKSRGYGVK